MMHRGIVALALVYATLACAHTQERSETAAHAVAQVMIAALAPAGSRAADNGWEAVQARVSPPVRWQGGALEVVRPDEPGSDLRRRGMLAGQGWRFAVTAQGSEALVRHFSIDVDDAVTDEALLAMLRAAGADVSFAGDDETAMFYYVSVPGREAAQLEARRVCSPYESREARHCRSVMMWSFELP
jgi:hypothetical protein